MLNAAIFVLALWCAFLLGKRVACRRCELRGYRDGIASARVLEDELRGLLQAMVIRNETLVTVLRQYAPELFDPRRFETDEVTKPH